MRADGPLDEFRKVALFYALRSQEGPQSEIGFLRYFDVPANYFPLHMEPTST
jgi:hypothetical protein